MEQDYRAKLEWVARNIERIKDFNFSNGNPYKKQIDETVDYIIESIQNVLKL